MKADLKNNKVNYQKDTARCVLIVLIGFNSFKGEFLYKFKSLNGTFGMIDTLDGMIDTFDGMIDTLDGMIDTI